jgi:hypothetical protein
MENRSIVVGGAAVVGILALGIASFGAFENLDASEIMVVQAPLSGDLDVFTEPGYKWQGWGKVTKYPRQAQYSFCSKLVAVENKWVEQQCDNSTTAAKRLRFNDGGHANLNGSVNWEMPLDAPSVINIHKKFGSAEGVESRAVGKMIDAAAYLAGPLMSSTESSGARRAELVQYINDQAESGVYATVAESIVTKDAVGNDVTEKVTKILVDDKGQPKRQQGSILGQFNVKLLPMSISELKYDNIVEQQIAQRQTATTSVQIARANAQKAEQDAITTEAQGKANAAKAKWDQETINAKEIAEAQKGVEVAKQAALEAEQYKKEQTLRGEGEAARKRAVMQADGALEKKLEAYIKVQGFWANAIQNYQGQLVPSVVMGGGSGANAGSNSQALIEMLSAKTAKELALDLSNAGVGVTKK